MKVELIFLASPTQTFNQTLTFEAPLSVKEVLLDSELFKTHPELSIDFISVGIFSQKVPLDHMLADGERIEVYRDLTISPMEKRRLLADRKK